jgi:hypothetical protein
MAIVSARGAGKIAPVAAMSRKMQVYMSVIRVVVVVYIAIRRMYHDFLCGFFGQAAIGAVACSGSYPREKYAQHKTCYKFQMLSHYASTVFNFYANYSCYCHKIK